MDSAHMDAVETSRNPATGDPFGSGLLFPQPGLRSVKSELFLRLLGRSLRPRRHGFGLHTCFHFLAALWAAVCVLCFSANAEENATGDTVVRFCREHLGQQVGDGECFALARHALRSAGFPGPVGQSPNKGDYVWGKLIAYVRGDETRPVIEGQLASVAPGDIIQFRDTKFKSHHKTEHFTHHTAVISEVSDKGAELKILQQNFAGKKVVTELNLHVLDLKEGWIRIYRPTKAGKEIE